MPLHLITGPAHSGKSDYVVDKFRQLLNESPVLLVPTGLDVQMWRKRLVKALGVLTFGKVETFGSFTKDLHRQATVRLPILNASGMKMLVRHVVEQERESLGQLKEAAGRANFGSALAGIISEMENCGLTPAGLKEAMASQRDALFYGHDVLTLFSAYQKRLAELGYTDAQLASADTADALAGSKALWQTPIFLAGFADFTPTEGRLLRSLSAGADVYVAITYEPDNPALAWTRRTVEDLTQVALTHTRMPSPARSASEYSLLSAGGRRGEVELVGGLIARSLRSGASPGSIGVIVRDIAPYRSLFAEIFTSYHIPHAVTERLPSRLTSVGAAVISVLGCLSGNADDIRTELTAFLRSPYSGAESEIVDEFDHLARRYGISDRTSLVELIDETDVLRHSKMFRDILTNPPRDTVDLLDSLRALLPAMWLNAHSRSGCRDAQSTQAELRDTAAVRSIGDELAILAKFAHGAELSAGHTIIAELISDLRVSGGSPGPDAVIITDAADCHTFTFREVFILGLNQQEFPRLSEEEPFFSDDERLAIAAATGTRLPLRAGETDRERYLFYQALTRGNNEVYLSSRYCDADGRDEGESFYLQDIRDELQARKIAIKKYVRDLGDMTLPLELVPTSDELRRSLAARFSDRPHRDLAQAAGLKVDIEAAAGRQAFRQPTLTNATTLGKLRAKQRFGATELETYLGCPFKWFVEKLVRPVSITPDSEPLLTGKLAHRVLAAALPEALNGAEQARTILARYINEAVAGIADQHEDLIQARVLAARLLAMLTQFVEGELRRLAAPDGFTPVHYEHSFGAGEEREVRLSEDVILTGRVDRIDKGPGDSAFVVDYKTGALADGAIGDFDKNGLLQGLLYSLAVQQDLGYKAAGCGYYSLKKQRWKYLATSEAAARLNIGGRRADVSQEQYAATLAAAADKALDVIGDIRSGDISLSPRKTDLCLYCEKAICRGAQERWETMWS